MTSLDIFNHLGWKGPFTPDYEYRVFLALQLSTDVTELTTLIEKGTRVNARSRIPEIIHSPSGAHLKVQVSHGPREAEAEPIVLRRRDADRGRRRRIGNGFQQ